ncbi:hypothetical protein CMI47_23255 [Candidatus Pacearchaeota archaeon]|jgi:glycosyltransferase involved in cell wall biosynthesis|nr:hypothetical protein [Candidatus Pacearchaeota archaeon]
MKKRIFLKAPLLTRSGYGEQARFLLRALRSREELFDIFIQPLEWGKTSWISEVTEERQWIDETIEKTIAYLQQGGQFDASIQVTIPNEWEKLAPINIGYTAGIETTKVAAPWLQRGNDMDSIIVVSSHSKNTYEKTVYTAENPQTKHQTEYRLTTPITTVNFPIKKYDTYPDVDLELEYDFNFLVMAQMGPRKNVGNTIKWFIEEFRNEEVGLVLKTNMAKNCLLDREKVYHDFRRLVERQGPRKCKMYLLHGDMEDNEVHSLYLHPQIKAVLSLTHGEGFGLPLFEAAYSEVPVIAPGWSGQLDFLVNRKTGKTEFFNVEYDLQPIPEQVVWEGVIIKESMWAYPREHSAKQKMRECYANYEEAQQQAATLAARVTVEFREEKQNEQMVNVICDALGINSVQQDEQIVEFG